MSFCGSYSFCFFGGLGGEKTIKRIRHPNTRPIPSIMNTKAWLAMKSRIQVTSPTAKTIATRLPQTWIVFCGFFWMNMKKRAIQNAKAKRGVIFKPGSTTAPVMIFPKSSFDAPENATEDASRRNGRILFTGQAFCLNIGMFWERIITK